MEKEEALKVLVLIERIYPLIIIKSETVLRWLEISNKVEYQGVMSTLHIHMKINPYPPTMRQLAKSQLSVDELDSEGWLSEYSVRNS